jgi:hypothetical protein
MLIKMDHPLSEQSIFFCVTLYSKRSIENAPSDWHMMLFEAGEMRGLSIGMAALPLDVQNLRHTFASTSMNCAECLFWNFARERIWIIMIFHSTSRVEVQIVCRVGRIATKHVSCHPLSSPLLFSDRINRSLSFSSYILYPVQSSVTSSVPISLDTGT